MLIRRLLILCLPAVPLVAGCAINPRPDDFERVAPSMPWDEPALPEPAAGDGDVVHASSHVASSPISVAQGGIYHPLERGMTLYKLSKTYGVPVETLLAANEIEDASSIPVGTLIFVPGARQRLEAEPPRPPAEPSLGWPLEGRVTSPFGSSARRKHHAGIDIDGKAGQPIRAARDGRVARVADNARYGLLVVVEHEDGYATWYAHASGLAVVRGDEVTAGQVIAYVGTSGNARGSHLHFEVRRHGRPVDPLPFLR